MSTQATRTALVTGGSGFIGKRLIRKLAREGWGLYVLCREGSRARMLALCDEIGRSSPAGPPKLIMGDVAQPRLGLSEYDLIRLRDDVEDVFHLAAVYNVSVPFNTAIRANVDGTRHVLDLADELPGLRRLHYASTIAVAGDFAGRYYEDDFEVGQRFHSAYAMTKYQAEAMVRARREDLPIDIYRIGVTVGDSRTGEMDKIDGPYFFFRINAVLRYLPSWLPLIGLGGPKSYVHAVPVDFVVDALVHLAKREAPSGQTYCVTDPNPLSVPEFLKIVVDHAGGPRVRAHLPVGGLLRAMSLPGVASLTHRLSRALPVPTEALTYIAYKTTFDTSHTLAALAGSGIRCPPVREYLPKLLDYYEGHLRHAEPPANLKGG